MSADLHLVAVRPDDPAWEYLHHADDEDFDVAEEVRTGVYDLPEQWIGQVSWLKADLDGDSERYIPGPVLGVVRAVGDGVILTPGVARQILAAMNLPNRSIYGRTRTQRLTDPERVEFHREVSRTARGRSMYGRFLEPNRVTYRSAGLARRRHVKAWLAANTGAWVVQQSW